ncbi:YheC/YheD family protein [Bacillus toyonensis]|uniref:YheC/YheD family protein n=1 Tax=Bacillus toyonensis TaxID=155322 RepID=UPI002714B6C8|nr:YheC/YheD family protein [Bacillus toyonensis]
MRRRKKQKKLSKRIIIHEEQLHQELLKIDDKEALLSPEISQLKGKQDFISFFDMYQHVILTPSLPHLDTESLEILLDASGIYMIKFSTKILWFSQKYEMLSYVEKHISLACYKIQQYIPWATIENHPFDVKVILHRGKNNFIWKVTEKYVEALHKILTIHQAIPCSNLKELDIEQLLKDIDKMALKIVQSKEDFFLRHHSVGFNIRLDHSGEMWITQIGSNPIKVKGNKKSMYQLFKTDPHLSLLIPETKEVENESALLSFLDQYLDVIVKPISGSLGKGIMRLIVGANNQYTLQHTNKIFQFTDTSELLLFLKQKIKSKPYIIQQYIQLSKVKNSPFDLRVIVQQKSNDHNWKITGIYAKVAFDGYFTTNLAKKGTVMTVKQAIHDSDLTEMNDKELLEKINDAALRVAHKLNKISPHHRIWGLDMGIDSNGEIWIIEVNSKPGIQGFKRLEDQNMYRTIRNYKNQ